MAKTMESKIVYRVIGTFRSEVKKTKAQAARQGSEDQHQDQGYIELLSGNNFEQGLEDLDGFSHLWIIFDFHLSKSWKPKVQPPRFSDRKVGVFASRSPYRPNSIGLTLTQIQRVQGRKIYLKGTDLIDGTPILDIKPYLTFSDSVIKAKLGWIGNAKLKQKSIRLLKKAQDKIHWLEGQGIKDLRGMIHQHLSTDAFNSKSKRVQKLDHSCGRLALRKWRIDFKETKHGISVTDLTSAFAPLTDQPHAEDPVHRNFTKKYRQV